MNKTTQKLMAALEEALAPTWMINKAENMMYDDFLSESPFPIADLVYDCRNEGLYKIANRAIDGDFDATKEESDAWAASPDGQTNFKQINGKE